MGAGIQLVALDLDGVVWRGGTVLPGVREALEDVLRRGLDLRYVSNNSTAHREAVSERLADMGLPSGTERVLTSGFVTGRWLRERLLEAASVLVVGEEGLLRELREAGLAAYSAADAAAHATPAAVVVGMDRSFSYETLAAAQAAIRVGALFVATNRDATFPTPQGLAPGAGAIVAAVATAAEMEPVLMGKPGLALAKVLAAVSGIPAAQTLFVGDRLTTDIAMGRDAGMVTALVLTGVTTAGELRLVTAAAEAVGAIADGGAFPDHVLSDLADLPRLLDDLGVQA
jgi:phosphoglycolate/pyridoxal phosphate phosphatase family enzyme